MSDASTTPSRFRRPDWIYIYRFCRRDGVYIFDRSMPTSCERDAKARVEELRRRPGYDAVYLIGHTIRKAFY